MRPSNTSCGGGDSPFGYSGGGGGGSSYVTATGSDNVSHTAGFNAGDGGVVISG
jgi:hypothetical protein